MIRTPQPSLLALLLLPLFLLSACGDEETTDLRDDPVPREPRRLPEVDPERAWPDYNPEDEAAFEEAVYRQHLHLMGQVSKRAIDSIMQIHLLGARNLKEGKERANRELNRWMERQDTLARNALVNQFAISRDSVDAILRERGEQR